MLIFSYLGSIMLVTCVGFIKLNISISLGSPEPLCWLMKTFYCFFFVLFEAYDTSLWNTASSICGDVSSRWHVRSPFNTSGTAPLFRSFCCVLKLVNVCVISVNVLFRCCNRDLIHIVPMQCLLLMEWLKLL